MDQEERTALMVTAEPHRDGNVVVGIDGSEHSMDALRWGAAYAHAMGLTLRPIVAWSYPQSADFAAVPGEEFEDVAKADLNDALQLVRAEFPGLAVDPAVAYGPSASVLIEASRSADLLVVGTRGHGGFTGMLLGSVSMHCVHHASCPVVVVRHASGTS